MTLYAGELVKITQTALKDDEALLPDDITAVWLTLYNAEAAIVVDETEMDWDATFDRWQYLWDTTGVDPGSYRARVRVEGVDGGSVWEYQRFRLTRNPVEL